MTPMRPRQHDATKAELRREERRRHGRPSNADLEAEAERQDDGDHCPLCGAPPTADQDLVPGAGCECLEAVETEWLRSRASDAPSSRLSS